MDTDLLFENEEEFASWILEANKRFPKLVKKHYRLIGRNATKIAKRIAKQTLNTKTGNYLKGFKGSKVWSDGVSYKVSAYNSAPHSHLIEYGHRLVKGKGTNARVLGFVKGFYILTKAEAIYSQDKHVKDLNEVINKILEDGGY